ncbi:MAG TPA: peptidoglycan recognition family protein [Planctomycetota bacterium]|nr:peptidoglycan recognition family protein [Planctomycetota bacterium]
MNRNLTRCFRRARRSALALLLFAVSFSACYTPQPPPMAPPEPDPVMAEPVWLKQPLSWEKLVAIEEWLQNEGAKHSPGFRIEAELQLNEGRVNYSRQDLEKGTAPPETIRLRVEAARDGFTAIQGDADAGPGAKTRAKIGLQSALALLDVPVVPHKSLVIVQRSQWKATEGRTARLTPLKGRWSRITIHHSDESKSSRTGGTLEDSEEVVRAIQKYHMEDVDHGWGDIGYHFLIDSAGRIFEGRDLKWQGAHAGGAGGMNNTQNIGVCMLGDFLRQSPTPAALNSLKLLVDSLNERYEIQHSRVYPHKHFGTTQCPGPALTAWIKKNYP